jgi:hypothetical protein
MSILLRIQEIQFHIDAELNSVVRGMSDVELSGFARLYEEASNYEDLKLSIFSYFLMFKRNGSTENLEEAIRRAKIWVTNTAADHLSRPQQLRIIVSLLAEITRVRLATNSLHTIDYILARGDSLVDDLNSAIYFARLALRSTPEDHDERVTISNDLGAWLVMRFYSTASLDDLNNAIEVAGAALDGIPHGHPDLAFVSINLGTWLAIRFQQTQSFEDLTRAIETGQRTLDSIPQYDPQRTTLLKSLESWLFQRFNRTGSPDDLDSAIKIGRAMLECVFPDDSDMSTVLVNLGSRLGTRYEQTDSLDDLYQAINFVRLALDLAPENHNARSAALINITLLSDMIALRSESPESKKSLSALAWGAGRRLDFESSPPIEEVHHTIRTASLNLEGIRFEGKCRVYWHLERFCEQQLKQVNDLRKIITIAGTTTFAEANSCEEFVKKTWKSSNLVDFLVAYLQNPAKRGMIPVNSV